MQNRLKNKQENNFFEASYLNLYRRGDLENIVERANRMLESCSICPRRCRINRFKENNGFCRTGLRAKIYSYMAHHGEEPPISGRNGSGTIFFSSCNMHCVYCQNFEFSQGNQGKEIDSQEFAGIMLELQKKGCHNINLVTPTHVMPQIIHALYLAVKQGLIIPICYNTSGYEIPEIIAFLSGIVDIYLTDARYADSQAAVRYSEAYAYPDYNKNSIKEMHKQTKEAIFDKEGIMKRGLIIRHLVLPNNISGTEKIMKFIAEEVSKDAYISLMSQYLPCYQAGNFEEINRRITKKEYLEAQKIMQKYELYNGWTQDAYGLESLAGINIKPSL